MSPPPLHDTFIHSDALRGMPGWVVFKLGAETSEMEIDFPSSTKRASVASPRQMRKRHGDPSLGYSTLATAARPLSAGALCRVMRNDAPGRSGLGFLIPSSSVTDNQDPSHELSGSLLSGCTPKEASSQSWLPLSAADTEALESLHDCPHLLDDDPFIVLTETTLSLEQPSTSDP
jgi:hypothetical protein